MPGIRLTCVAALGAAWLACGRSTPPEPNRESIEAPQPLETPGAADEGPEHLSGGGHAESSGDFVGFVPPSTARRIRAIGSTVMLSAEMRRAFLPTTDFELIARPQPGEWLAEHYERGQTFYEFVSYRSNRPDERRNKLYLLPLTSDGDSLSLPMRTLADFTRAYFGLRVDVLPIERLDLTDSHTRSFETNTQFLTADILETLEQRLPEDAYALMAVTDADLYAAPDWNFVFGQASLRGRVGVMSLARLDPAAYGVEMEGDAARAILTRRALTVLAHEIGHIFGLKHCVFFRCVMGGANDLREIDSAPLHACPVCLRKLQKIAKFDPAERYLRLARLFRRAGLDDEADWARSRRRFVAGDD